jgi:hypothetical protein
MKNDEKIFFDFWLFSSADVNNTREKLFKTISDVKKMHLTRFFDGIKISCCMALNGFRLHFENAIQTQSFDEKLLVRTISVLRHHYFSHKIIAFLSIFLLFHILASNALIKAIQVYLFGP